MKSEEYSGEIMPWNRCEREFIRKVEIDYERIESIVKQARVRLKRAQNTEETQENISLIFEDYYEVVKEILVAYLLRNGMRSKNHQCLISFFLRENPNREKEAYLIQQMSFFRNRLNYYGEVVPSEFYKDNKDKFQEIIDFAISLIEEGKR